MCSNNNNNQLNPVSGSVTPTLPLFNNGDQLIQQRSKTPIQNNNNNNVEMVSVDTEKVVSLMERSVSGQLMMSSNAGGLVEILMDNNNNGNVMSNSKGKSKGGGGNSKIKRSESVCSSTSLVRII